MDKLDRAKLKEMMENDKEIEKLVDKYGIDGVISIYNNVVPLVIPIFESFIDVIQGIMESLNEMFSEADEVDDDLLELEIEESLFQRAIDMCDVDVRWRYSYLNELLCNLQDESMELYENIERANIDFEIAERLIQDYDVDVRNDLIYVNKRVASLTKELEELECRIEATTDIFDECFYSIMKNLD